MTSLQLTLSLAPLPTGIAEDANTFGQSLISNLSATLNGNILQGQTGGVQPITNIGPWFDGITWWFWNGNDNVYLPSPSSGTVYNVVGNAGITVMQRIPPASPTLDATYVVDRFKYRQSLLTGKAAVAQTAINYPAGQNYPHTRFALRTTCTVAEPAVGSTEYAYISQFIPVSRFRAMTDRPTAFSLLMTSSVAGTYYVTLRNRDASWTYLMRCVVAGANVPQYFQFNNISAFPSVTGNWGTQTETDFAYEVMIILTAGANFNTGLANTWNGSNLICGADQTNFFSTINNTLDVTLIQHQPGQTATPFIFRPFADDLWDCQQFFSKSYDYATAPGTATQTGGIIMLAPSASFLQGIVRYPRRMRAAPTLTIYSTSTGAAARFFDTIGAVDRTVTSVAGAGEAGFLGIQTSGISPAATGFAGGGQFQFAADADA